MDWEPPTESIVLSAMLRNEQYWTKQLILLTLQQINIIIQYMIHSFPQLP